MNDLQKRVWETGVVPLSWAGSTSKMDYLNFGDALSPVMVAFCTGLPVERIPFRSKGIRLGAVGTIGHAFEGGDVWFWGVGASPYKNPGAPKEQRVRYTVPGDGTYHVAATRGPVTRKLLGGIGDGAYGDPVWLLPQFYRPNLPKKYELGVIMHLSELADRSPEPHPRPEHLRFLRDAEFAGSVRLINTVTPIGIGALKDKLDEILSCKRIVSTSLHGMVIAESYGIPCLHFPRSGERSGLSRVRLEADGGTDLRIVDLYQGLGKTSLPVYVQPHDARTDWAALIRSVDAAWLPVACRTEDLLDALPLPASPVMAPAGRTVFDLPVLRALTLQHDVGALTREDRLRNGPLPDPNAKPPRRKPLTLARQALSRLVPRRPGPAPAVDARRKPPAFVVPADATPAGMRRLLEMNVPALAVPLSWAATTPDRPLANLGDALSPVIVSVMAGLPIVRRAFDADVDRMVSVGTIGQSQRNGTLSFWGTGFDSRRNPVDSRAGRYAPPANTHFHVHALRGPKSADILRQNGIPVPEVYGDPVWFLPKLFPRAEPAWDLGVIVHLTELDGHALNAAARKELARYAVPAELRDSVRIINTLAEPTIGGLAGKVAEITSCRRIVSTSLHGLVIAETYGIPCAWFAAGDGGPQMLNIAATGAVVDHRIQDFYLGARRRRIPVFAQDRGKATPWDAVMAWVDQSWEPLAYDARLLFDAFPIPAQVAFESRRWVSSLDQFQPIVF